METIKFSFDWNRKLQNKAFTTIRLNDQKYQMGVRYLIELKGEIKGVATLVDMRKLTIDQLNNFVTYLDTGYNVEQTTRLLQTMYKNQKVDWESQLLVFCLLVYDDKETETII